ncbi:hypothetical protein GALMADRAFT_565741 [Galerina marginata CBS 339.88]|uniref:Uncharacterized protein n=1 Tax=Galerina marginata (strain CBS 339.88) TaxID=685588 RepID=A0A067T791_GALM3|nr:hypothetical protein GALMADRAFT_565741 [Galerina marginata CBS 339.88]
MSDTERRVSALLAFAPSIELGYFQPSFEAMTRGVPGTERMRCQCEEDKADNKQGGLLGGLGACCSSGFWSAFLRFLLLSLDISGFLYLFLNIFMVTNVVWVKYWRSEVGVMSED